MTTDNGLFPQAQHTHGLLTVVFKKKKNMKKILLAIALFAVIGANAQNDGFFTIGNYSEYRDVNDWGQNLPGMPGQHGMSYDYNAETPLGSGLLILGGLAFAYGIRRKKMKED